MAKSEIEFGTSLEEDQVDEMDFGSIGKTLSKYGKGVPADEPKKVKRSAVNTDYTMTGHKEKKSSTGRVYSKVLPDDEDSGKAAKAVVAAEPAVKRGRGRPAGALNKNGSGVTGKGWSDEAKASMKAKLADRKAAKLAAANESEELNEEDWADITEGQSLDSIVEFMLDEEYRSLDELSKDTLSSYVNKASQDAAYKDRLAGKAHNSAQTIKFKTRADKAAMIDRAEKYSDDADSRRAGIKKALSKQHESEELDELSKTTLASYSVKALKDVGKKSLVAKHLRKTADAQDDEYAYKAADQNRDAADKIETNASNRLSNVGKAGYRIRKESELDKVAGQHRISVTVSDPNHEMVSKRKEQIQKIIRAPGVHSKDVAVENAKKYYKKMGYKVHDAEHIGMTNESEELDEASEELDESVDPKVAMYASKLTGNLIKE